MYVGGAGGNVGTAATAMAHRAGARVVAGARPADHDWCRAAGADIVVDYRDPDLVALVHDAAPAGVDVFWDTSGHHEFDLIADVVTPRARVLLTAAATSHSQLPVAQLYTRDVTLHGFLISRAAVEDLAAAATLINTMLSAGELSARIAEVLPLTATAQAHARLEAGKVDGRLLLRP